MVKARDRDCYKVTGSAYIYEVRETMEYAMG